MIEIKTDEASPKETIIADLCHLKSINGNRLIGGRAWIPAWMVKIGSKYVLWDMRIPFASEEKLCQMDHYCAKIVKNEKSRPCSCGYSEKGTAVVKR